MRFNLFEDDNLSTLIQKFRLYLSENTVSIMKTYWLMNSKRFRRWCIILCGDGSMNFIHRPKSKI
jgi:hypothetical protein